MRTELKTATVNEAILQKMERFDPEIRDLAVTALELGQRDRMNDVVEQMQARIRAEARKASKQP